MKKYLVLLLILFYSTVSGQILETIGSGVVDFLLSSPSTANKMNTDQQIALSIIGGLLDKAGQMKHQTNVATAGQTQITLNTNSGQQIQLAMDTNGNVYAISNGIIYPIGQNVVNQAKEYVLNQQPGYMDYIRTNKSTVNSQLMLPDYNLLTLKTTWAKEKPYEIINPVNNKKCYISDILEKYDVVKEQLFFTGRKNEPVFLVDCDKCAEDYLEDNKKLFPFMGSSWTTMAGLGMEVKGYKRTFEELKILSIPHTPLGTFTAGWYNDMNGNNSLEFNEFQDIRRNFYQDESIIITCGLYSNYEYYAELKIFEQSLGTLIHTEIIYDNDNIFIGNIAGFISFPKDYFNPGIYTYHISFIRKNTNTVIESLTDKFQILSSENVNEKTKNSTRSTNSSLKSDSISELIQLLKEGKISEETFKVSMQALKAN